MATEMTHDDVLAIAEAIAMSWERRREQIEELSAPVRQWLVRALDPREGDTVLELAAGAGDTGFDAATIVGPSGRLLSTDFSPAMVGVARRRGAERHLSNAEYRVIDAQHIELPADSVDGVICRFGYMLMPDPARALSEAHRVLRPGGRLALAVLGAAGAQPVSGSRCRPCRRRSSTPCDRRSMRRANGSRTSRAMSCLPWPSVRSGRHDRGRRAALSRSGARAVGTVRARAARAERAARPSRDPATGARGRRGRSRVVPARVGRHGTELGAARPRDPRPAMPAGRSAELRLELAAGLRRAPVRRGDCGCAGTSRGAPRARPR